MKNTLKQLPEEKIIIIDYDNIDSRLSQRGAYVIIGNILEKLSIKQPTARYRYVFRFYGGWYENYILTRRAQDLTLDLSTVPKVFPVVTKNESFKVNILPELAYSLAALPASHLYATYRKREFSNSIQCRDPATIGCKSASCRMQDLYYFINNKQCLDKQCVLKVTDILYKAEQKLVDTMMLSDIIYFAQKKHSDIVVVSSDDDLWPGMLMAILNGSKIHHIRTHSKIKDPYGYAKILNNKYVTTTIN